MKNIDWNKVMWYSLKALLVLIMNTPLLVLLIGSFVPYGQIGEFRLSWIDYLKLSDKVEWYHIWILYAFIPVGIGISYAFIKFLYNKRIREKDIELRQQETNRVIDAINTQKTKELEKERKMVKKYLGVDLDDYRRSEED